MARIQLTDEQLRKLMVLAHSRWGLEISEHKRTLVNNRINRLIRAGRYPSVDEMLEDCQANEAGLMEVFDVLSTNHTSFFREREHFDCVVENLVRPAIEVGTSRGRRLRFWSAACSNGSEPYTLAMILHETIGDLTGWDVRILATDLSTKSVDAARRGVYTEKCVRDLPERYLAEYFEPRGERFVVNEQLKKLMTFGIVNLNDAWRMRGPFDAIFCRNVMIYFNQATKDELVRRLTALLRPGGLLFVGSSEGLVGRSHGLESLRPGAYRRRAEGVAA